jgi:hypothetical protein
MKLKMFVARMVCTGVLGGCFLAANPAPGQSAQVGADRGARGKNDLRVEYVHYRPAVWEQEQVKEYESDIVNEGGLFHVYCRNVTDKRVDLRFWRFNGQDESYWRLNHFIAWDRAWDKSIEPGEYCVLEINAVTDDFAEGNDADFYWVNRAGSPSAHYAGKLLPDPVRISFVRVLPGLDEVEVHVRYSGDAKLSLGEIGLANHTVRDLDWKGAAMKGAGHAIARFRADPPLQNGELMILNVAATEGGEDRTVYTHRRAFADYFPIGVWSGTPESWEMLHRHHIDTFVAGHRKEDAFYQDFAYRLGLRCMVHTGIPVSVDTIRSVQNEDALLCWMIMDEPDWSIPSNIMEFVDRTVRMYDSNKPTFITLCRNIKFFEYASIADIPCQDHYSVTAPSSSIWPKFYGTRLEETAYYTRDLKEASEPKPIWIWSQAIANWGERPKRPVPTPEELASQLIFNLGRGAKGILWFNYDDEVARKYPDVLEAMRDWGRVMGVLREDFLASDPLAADVKAADDIDVALLAARDRMILCVNNLDYEIDPEAYPFTEKANVEIEIALPDWITPAAVVRVAPDGIAPAGFKVKGGRLTVTLDRLKVCDVLVALNEAEAAAAMKKKYAALLAAEK